MIKQTDDTTNAVTDGSTTDPPEPQVGGKAKIFCPLDNAYYPGLVSEEEGNSKTVLHEDRGIETLQFGNEAWRYASSVSLWALSAQSMTLSS